MGDVMCALVGSGGEGSGEETRGPVEGEREKGEKQRLLSVNLSCNNWLLESQKHPIPLHIYQQSLMVLHFHQHLVFLYSP